MKRAILLVLPMLLLGPPAWGAAQTVKLPAEVKVQPGRLAAVLVDWDGDDIRWDVPAELDAFREYDPDPKKVRLRFQGWTPGKYRVIAVAARGGKLSDFAVCFVIVEGKGPLPPDPPTPPDPPPPISGFTVLIVVESADLTSLPAKQQLVLGAKVVSDYLNAKCVKVDGHPEWRIFDKDKDLSKTKGIWKDVMALPRSTLPWIVVGNGKIDGYSGPLPATVEETMVLLKKYGG